MCSNDPASRADVLWGVPEALQQAAERGELWWTCPECGEHMQAADITAHLVRHKSMTVKELHTLSDAELDIVEDALRIAKAHYQSLVETVRIPGFQVQFEEQAREASELQLKIEASR